MAKLFDTKPEYIRLDDDVSFQLLRTNPRLTTNTKLMYDGKNLYMESYSANALLSTMEYKNVKVNKTSLFNVDIRNFLSGTGSSAYDVYQNMSDTIVGDTFDNQFENTYWSGAESINSKVYTQELGFIAPLYLRKKLPNYFVIFKVKDPVNINLVELQDQDFNFKEDILDKMSIIKSFDLREGTPIGDYIRKYVEQYEFNFDQSVYVNYGSREIYYYGIDKFQGVLTKKVENFDEQLLKNDNTILHSDDWITEGFHRNNLIFPYIINFEYLFDDNETKDYQFARYFGLYCNDVDMFDIEPKSLINGKIKYSKNEELCSYNLNDESLYYIKDKFNELYSIKKDNSEYGNYIDVIDKSIDFNHITGYETETISTYAERIVDNGYPVCAFKITKKLVKGDNIVFYNDTYKEDDTEYHPYKFASFVADDAISTGEFYGNHFSCDGTIEDTIKSLADCISAFETEYYKWITAYCDGDIIVIKSTISSKNMDNMIKMRFNCPNKIEPLIYIFEEDNTLSLKGGSDTNSNTFLINLDDINIFVDNSGDRSPDRFIKTTTGRTYSKIVAVTPYINEYNLVDENLGLLITDSNGKYIKSNTANQIEIVDRFYPKIGALSMFPVKDFDFDTVYSSYGESYVMKKEFSLLNGTTVDEDEEIYGENSKKVTIEIEVTLNDGDEDDLQYEITGSNYIVTSKTGTNEKLVDFIIKAELPEGEDPEFDIDINREKITDIYSNMTGRLKSVSYSRFTDNDGMSINNEYEYYYENILPELCTVSKTVPYIAKWSYFDDCKDSCENPYRLNMSKIFDTCNFSANTFVQNSCVNEYTHSMPYYLNNYDDIPSETFNVNKSMTKNSYQYVYNNVLDYDCYDYKKIINSWIKLFKDKNINNFEKLFIDTSNHSVFTNKRFDKKYSRFLLGNDKQCSSTLFRGVKFNIIEMKNGEETYSSKFNDYKFSFIYIPISINNISFSNKVFFVKNDTFKFIVGMVFVNAMKEYNAISDDDKKFTQAYLYGGNMDDISCKYTSKMKYKNISDIYFKQMPISEIFGYDEYKNIIDIETLYFNSSTILRVLKNIDDPNCISDITFDFYYRGETKAHRHQYSVNNGDTIIVNEYGKLIIYSKNKMHIYHEGEVYVSITFKNVIKENIFDGLFDKFNEISVYNLKTNINEELNVSYNSDDYKIRIIDPDSIETYDVFTTTPVLVNKNNQNIIGSIAVTLKSNTRDLALKIINRYSGYYNPIFNDVLFYNNIDDCSYINTSFDYEYNDRYGKFGCINNMWFHKVNEEKSYEIINTSKPIYPILGEYAIDYKKFNIFSSSWDSGFYTKQFDIKHSEDCENICSMKNGINMFGSKYFNVPETITIDSFDGCSKWNDDWISDTLSCPTEMMYKEVNGNNVNYYLFLQKRIIRYFCENTELRSEFRKYISPAYSYGLTNTIDDDIEEYVKKNILKLYKLDSITLWIKKSKKNIHDGKIENDYSGYVSTDVQTLKKIGFAKVNTSKISKMSISDFDRRVVYSLARGCQEDIAFSFTIKKI